MSKTLINEIATVIDAYRRASLPSFRGNPDAAAMHLDRLADLEARLPSGSGIDGGCNIVVPGPGDDPEIVTIAVPYRHMNDVGYYVGWVTYVATVTPSLASGFDLSVECYDDGLSSEEALVEDTCEYLADVLCDALAQPFEAPEPKPPQPSLAHRPRVEGEWPAGILPLGFAEGTGADGDTVAHVYAPLVGLTCTLVLDVFMAGSNRIQVRVLAIEAFSAGTMAVRVRRVDDIGRASGPEHVIAFYDIIALLVQ